MFDQRTFLYWLEACEEEGFETTETRYLWKQFRPLIKLLKELETVDVVGDVACIQEALKGKE